MAMTIPKCSSPIVCITGHGKLMSGTEQSDWKKFLRGTVAAAAVFAAALLFLRRFRFQPREQSQDG